MKLCFILFLASIVSSCGVKGDPIPPKTPKDLGRGQPTYKGATQELAPAQIPPVYAPSIEKEEEKKK
jgi:hypothetical protein